MSVRIVVSSSRVSYDFSFYGRYCVILGNSGVGKSDFVRSVFSKSGKHAYKIEVYENGVLSSNDRLINLSNVVSLLKRGNIQSRDMLDDIYIVDDDDTELDSIVDELLKSTKYARYIFVTRNNISRDRGLCYSTDSVFNVVTNGARHYLSKVVNDIDVKCSDKKIKTLVLSEDSLSGLNFYKKLFNCDVRCIVDRVGNITGKDYIMTMLRSVVNDYDRFVLLVDWCSFGRYVNDLSSLFAVLKSKELLVFFDIKSFEYLLLKTNLIQSVIANEVEDKYIFSEYKLLKEVSEERYYERMLEDVTLSKEFYQKHGNDIKPCYVNPCCSVKQFNYGVCGYYFNGDKIKALFKGTEFEYLLKYKGRF